MAANTNNGRVDTSSLSGLHGYDLFLEEKPSKTVQTEAIRSVHTDNELARVFFSRANIDALQDGIRYMVYKKSCGKFVIGKQSEAELTVIMRSIYLQQGQFLPYGILDQVKQLNTDVLNYCVPRITEEVRLYMQYKRDISQLPVPMERGEFISAKGTKTLETKQF